MEPATGGTYGTYRKSCVEYGLVASSAHTRYEPPYFGLEAVTNFHSTEILGTFRLYSVDISISTVIGPLPRTPRLHDTGRPVTFEPISPLGQIHQDFPANPNSGQLIDRAFWVRPRVPFMVHAAHTYPTRGSGPSTRAWLCKRW